MKATAYYFTISTWRGLAPGAQHYYGRIRWKDTKGERQESNVEHMMTELCRHCCYYRIGDKDRSKPESYQRRDGKPPGCVLCDKGWVTGLTGAFYDRKEAIESAKQWFRAHTKNKQDILFQGDMCSGDPIEILYGPADFKKRGNSLWKQAVKIDYYENDEKKMNKISIAWMKLTKKYL